MAKKATTRKAVHKSKAPKKSRTPARKKAKRQTFTSQEQWKRTGAKRWPRIERALARAMETEGSLGEPRTGVAPNLTGTSPQPIAGLATQPLAEAPGQQMATSRLAALN